MDNNFSFLENTEWVCVINCVVCLDVFICIACFYISFSKYTDKDVKGNAKVYGGEQGFKLLSEIYTSISFFYVLNTDTASEEQNCKPTWTICEVTV